MLSKNQPAWIDGALEALTATGFAVVTDVLSLALLDACRSAMRRTHAAILADVGRERLERAKELGVLRLMQRYEPLFFCFLELPEVLALVDRTVSPTAIMHLQNGCILPSFAAPDQPRVFQNSYHQDFPRLLNGYLTSINLLFAIDGFTRQNGATWVVPGSHQRPRPSDQEIDATAVALECPAGSMIVFDSTLWHAVGSNTSGANRMAINHQFTRSYIKQQIDYVRALGRDTVLSLPPRSQQLLGWYTRLPTSLDEYYQPAEERLYRGGQG